MVSLVGRWAWSPGHPQVAVALRIVVGLLKREVGDGREGGEDGGGVQGGEVREAVQLEAAKAEANQQATQLRSVVQRWGRRAERN